MLSPSGPFLHIGRVQKYYNEEGKYYFNNELIMYAEEHGYYFPKDHMLMPITFDYMDNDNIKYHVIHNWNPQPRALNMAADALERIYENIYVNFKPLTFDEALERAEKNTSAGYLYKKMKHRKKKDVFTDGYDMLKGLYNQLMNGKDVRTVFEMAPKVEIRAIEKLISEDYYARKQRTFVVGDTLHYIVGLTLYYRFNEQIVKTASDKEFWNAVGISIFKGGWNQVAVNLLSVSNTFTCYDEKAMESCVTVAIQKLIYNMRNRHIMGTPYEFMAMWYLENLLLGEVIDHRGNLFIKIGQNPSGHYMTLNDNGHALELKMLYHLAKKCFDTSQLVYLYRTTGVKILGDDSVVPDSQIWEGLMESSNELGFNTTIESECQPLEKTKFIGFSFKFDVQSQMYGFVPDYDKLFSGLFFNRKSNSWRLTLARLYAMKQLCYGDYDKYTQVTNYISLIKTKYEIDLIKETNFDEILSLKALHGQDMSLPEIRRLVFQLE